MYASKVVLPALMAVALAGLLAGCGGSDKEATSSGLPACAKVDQIVSLPKDFPDELPIPDGTVFTASEHLEGGLIRIGGVVPQQFSEAVAFFREELPAAGFPLGEGDAEQDEAESAFSGRGYAGKWKVNGILNCAEAVTLAIAVSKQ